MTPAFALLLLLAAPAAATDSPNTRTVRLIYASDIDFSTGMDLLGPLEQVISSDSAHIKIEGIETLKTHFNLGAHSFSLPEGADAFKGIPIPALDAPKETLYLFATGYTLLERVLAAATKRGGDVPGARAKPAHLLTGKLPGGAQGRAVGYPDAMPSSWRPTISIAYHLRIDGKPVTVVLSGKPRGGSARVRAYLKKRVAEVRDPVIQFNVGYVVMPPEFPAKSDELLKEIVKSGDRFIAFASFDIKYGWEAMLAAGIPLLATNLKPGPGAPASVVRWKIEEAGGVRIGFLSLLPPRSRVYLDLKKAPFTVQDPVEAARDAVKALREVGKTDLIVVVSHLTSEEDNKLMDEVEGIDLFLEGKERLVGSSRRITVDFENWNRENHRIPGLRVFAPMHTYNELAARFRDVDGRPELTRLEQLPGPVGEEPGGEDSEFDQRMLDYFLSPSDAILPDPRALWPDTPQPKLNYRAPEFWNLAAQVLRQKTGAEVAFLRVTDLQSNTTARLTEVYVRQWLDASGHIVTAKLPGSALKALLKRVPKTDFPILDQEGPEYSVDIALRAAGADGKGRVSGIPITDSEIYTVATTEELLAMTEEMPELKQAQDAKVQEKVLGDVVLDALVKRPKSPQADRELREALEGDSAVGTVWRLNLRDLSLQFAETQVRGNGSLGGVPDARVQAVSQVETQGTARLFSELYAGKLRWDAGVSADYGKVTIRPPGAASFSNVTRDRLTLETEVRHRTRWVESGQFALGPFAALSYSTQFSKPPGTPRSQAFMLKAGAKLFDGPRLKELYVAPVVSKDYSVPEPHAHYGGAAGLRWDSALPGTPIFVKGQVEYVEYAKERYDAPWDLRRTLDATVKLSVPFYAGLRLSPFVNYYLFEGKVPDRTGYNILFGVSLEFSRLWKPLF